MTNPEALDKGVEHLPKPDGVIRIVTWNMLFSAAHDGKKFEGLDADIIGLQEVTEDSKDNPGLNTAELTASNLGEMNVFYAQHRVRGGGGSAFLCSLEVESSREETLHQSRLNSRFRRIYQGMDCKLENGSFLTVGMTHLMTPLSTPVSRKRHMDRLIDIVAEHDERFILIGDFNARPNSSYLRRLQEEGGLVNCGPDFSVPTWSFKGMSNAESTPLTGLQKLLSRRLDYVLATPDVAVAVNDTHIMSAEPSDHSPLVVDIDVAELGHGW